MNQPMTAPHSAGNPYAVPQQMKPKKSKKKWIIGGVAALAIIAIAGGASGSDSGENTAQPAASSSIAAESSVTADDPSPTTAAAPSMEDAAGSLNEAIDSLDQALAGTSDEGDSDVPREYRNALRSAQNYVDILAFSKQGLYDQLTSEYGGQFPADAAQYAVDSLGA